MSLTDVKPGGKVVFTVTATGMEPLGYQWQKDGKDLTDGSSIRGTSTSTLSITAVQKGDEGGYTCVVSNTAGTVTSKPANLDLGKSISFHSVGIHIDKHSIDCLSQEYQFESYAQQRLCHPRIYS